MTKFGTTLYTVLEWITKFAYLQLLWIAFSLLGGVILGIFPSTIAMFAIVRQWLRGKTDIPVFQSFVQYYKADFLKSNKLGIFITLLLALISLDIFYISNSPHTLTTIPLFAFILLVLLFMFYIFPTFVHFELGILAILKQAFLLMLINPLPTFLMVITIASASVILTLVPALLFIFGGSIYAFLTMWLALHAFSKLQSK